MATGYKYQGIDLDDLLEPKQGNFNSPNPDFNGYSIENVSMANRFAAYNGRGWEKLFSSTYLYNGSPIQACCKGYKPTVNSRFYTISGGAGAGTRNVYISRTDSALTFSGDVNATFGPSIFRNGAVPHVIGIICCAGGGGGNSHSVGSGKSATTIHWGGGGGAIAWFLVNLDNFTFRLQLGKGGGYNVDGGATILYAGGTRIGVLEQGYIAYSDSANPSPYGNSFNIYTSDSHIFNVDGTILDNSHKNWVAGAGGGQAHVNNNVDVGGYAYVKFDASDTTKEFGTPRTTIPGTNSVGWGGGSLNGSMITSGSGTNGAGGASNSGSGGGGAAYFFY